MKTIIVTLGLCFTAYSQTPEQIVAMTLLGEARGEGRAGMYAVACVIKVRSVNRKLTPAQVCLQARQFSCWNREDPNRLRLPKLLREHPQAQYALFLARSLDKLDLSYTGNADHYLARGTRAKWAVKSKEVKRVGNHVFYKLK
jgi:spore germination cell wall hydrolase CwlJ-like protein